MLHSFLVAPIAQCCGSDINFLGSGTDIQIIFDQDQVSDPAHSQLVKGLGSREDPGQARTDRGTTQSIAQGPLQNLPGGGPGWGVYPGPNPGCPSSWDPEGARGGERGEV